MKKGEGARKKQRQGKVDAKKCDAAHDQSSVRGFSTDQRIDMEKLHVQQQMLRDKREETSIVALSIEEGAIGRQLRDAERRAEMRCPEYDKDNFYWKSVDKLIEAQFAVMERIRSFNHKSSVDKSDGVQVSDFLNQTSPKKSSNKRNLENAEDSSSGSNSESDNDEPSCNISSNSVVSK